MNSIILNYLFSCKFTSPFFIILSRSYCFSITRPPMSLHARPHSALAGSNRYDLSTKKYRVPQPQTYNKLKNDIYRTFSLNTSVTYTDIVELTKNSTKYSAKIDRLCSKYCIKPPGKNSISTNIDSQKIAKNFVRSKSNKKQSLQRKNYMNTQIIGQAATARVSSKKQKTQEFFKLTCENLRKIEKTQQKNAEEGKTPVRRSSKSKSRYNSIDEQIEATQARSHPYFKIYEQSQQEALKKILNNENIELRYEGRYPALQEAEQWQRYQKNVKSIYTGIKRMRYVHSAREKSKSSRTSFQTDRNPNNEHQTDRESFYIT